MISLKFKDFRAANYDDSENYELYILKHQKIMYIGISRRGIWNRWFSGWGSHLAKNYENLWFANTHAGRAIIENQPFSDAWLIELWTREDCLDFLKDEITELHYCIDRVEIENIEPLMIQKLKPELNSTFVNY